MPTTASAMSCFTTQCGCPTAYLEDWCAESNALIHSEWCVESETNCAQCGGVLCEEDDHDDQDGDDEEEISVYIPLEPPLPGIMPGLTKPKVILAQYIDYPPYAYMSEPPEGDYELAGFGVDVAKGLESVCDIDVNFVQTDWADCWDAGKIGEGLNNGHYHACMTYTHTKGERNRFLDFSYGILSMNKPAGLLTLLTDGVPTITGLDDLSGKKIVDVVGWAPTADALAMVTNQCTGNRFSGYEVVTPDAYDSLPANDAAMQMLRNGEADAMWVYADQGFVYQCDDGEEAEWDCDLWSGLGTEYAYVQTGLEAAYNGTTLTISKKGSGLPAILNPCIQKFMETEAYYDTCVKHDLTGSCYANDHFPAAEEDNSPWLIPTDELTSDCSSGYCQCP